MIVICCPFHYFRFETLVYPVCDAFCYSLLQAKSNQKPVIISTSVLWFSKSKSLLTERIVFAGMQWTNNSYNIPLISNNLSGLCSLKILWATWEQYFSQSGLGITSKLSILSKLSPSIISDFILLNVGSCTDNASNDNNALLKLPPDNRAKRIW